MATGTSLTWKRKITHGTGIKPDAEDAEFQRKKLKLSDLPIASSQRSAIDALLFKFKKSGEFDKLRKVVFAQFEQSPAKAKMTQALEELADAEIERQANYLLSKERRQAAALLEGAAERSNLYKSTESDIDTLVQELLGQAEDSMREIRRKDIGEEAALDEIRRGSKTEAEYVREFEERKQARLQVIEEEQAKLKQKEREEKVQAEERRRKRKEVEKAEEEARQAEREEREAKRKTEREEREKERELALEREREERRERWKRDEERSLEEERERKARVRIRSRSRHRDRSRSRSYDRPRRRSADRGVPQRELPKTEEELEAVALEELIREGKRMQEARRGPELEKDEALAPPPRKILPPKSIVPRDPAGSKLSKQSISKPDSKSSIAAITQKQDESRAASVVASVEKTRHTDERRRSRSRSRHRRESRRHSPSPDNRRSSRYEDEKRSSRYADDRDTHRRSSRYEDERELRRDRSRDSYRGGMDSYRGGNRRERSRERSRSRDRRPRERSRDRSRERSRSRSRSRRRGRDRSKSPRPARRARSRTPAAPEIDRYVPSTSRRSPVPTARRRASSRDRGDSYRAGDRDRKDSYRAGDRDSRHRYGPDDIDRYIPGQSSRARDEDERPAKKARGPSRSRSRDRGKETEKEREKEKPSSTRERDTRERETSKRERSRTASVSSAPLLRRASTAAATSGPPAPGSASGKLHFASLKWVKDKDGS